MLGRKRFYVALTLEGEARGRANRAELIVLGAELEEQARAEEILKATGLTITETIPCPPPADEEQDN